MHFRFIKHFFDRITELTGLAGLGQEEIQRFSFAAFAPAHLALQAAAGKLPGQSPLARVQG